MDGMDMAKSIGRVAIRELSRLSLPEALIKAVASREDGVALPARPRRHLMRLLATSEAQDALFDQSEAGTQRLAELIASNVLGPEGSEHLHLDVSEYSNRLAELLVTELFGVLALGPAFTAFAYKLRQIDSSMAAGFADLRSQIEATHRTHSKRGRAGGTRVVADVSEGIVYTPAVNGLAILGAYDLNPDDLAEMCNEINGFADFLTTIPLGPRSLLALIVSRGEELDPCGLHMGHASSPWTPAFEIRISVLKSLASSNARELHAHVEVLEQSKLLKVDLEPFDGPPVYIVGTPSIEWPLLQDIRKFATSDREQIARVLCDLDFSALDL